MATSTSTPFEFSTTPQIVFGPGTIERLPQIVDSFGTRVMLVTGATPARLPDTVRQLESGKRTVTHLRVLREPTIEDLELGLRVARDGRVDVVIAIGGGSVLDIGKAIAGLFNAEFPVSEYLEVVGAAKSIERRGLCCIAVPTTSGTGAEATRNSVLDIPSHGVKVSLRSPFLLPQTAIIDPELSLSLPRRITAETGFDALTQVIEPYVSNRANAITDALARAALERVNTSLRRVCTEPQDISARSDMALVSLWGGMCLANARLGAVHGLAGPLGGMLHAPHGAVCAALIGPVTRVNILAARQRGDAAETLARYQQVAGALTADPTAQPERAADWIEELAADLGIRRLGELGLARVNFAEAVERGMRASSMQGNPIRLEESALVDVLGRAL